MDKKDIIERVLIESGDFKNQSADELRELLDKELAKANPDYDLVDELTKSIIEAEGKKLLSADIDSELEKFQSKMAENCGTFRIPKWAVGLSAACVMLICANCISVAAWDKNIVSAVIEFTKGGFSVSFDKKDTAELPTSENDPFGMIAECAKYGIYPETPYYIPDGFELEHTSSNTNKNVSNMVRFIFKKGSQSISFDFEVYLNDVGQIGIPSDHYNISETEINGYPAIVSKEDNQYTITYQKDKTVFFMFADGVPYDECEKIVESIK